MRHQGMLVGGSLLLLALLCLAAKFVQFYGFALNDFDTGIYSNVAWNLINGEGFHSDVLNRNHLGVHFSPLTALFAPIYAVFPSPMVLMVGQGLAVGLALLLLYRMGTLILDPAVFGDRRPLIILAFCLLAFFYGPFTNALLSHFHPPTVVMPVLAGCLIALIERRTWLLALLVVVLLTAKENAALAVAGLGVYAALVQGRWRLGIVLGIIAAALGAYSIAMLFQKDASGLNDVLEAYADPYAAAGGSDEKEEGNSFAKNLFVKRAVEITEGFAERQGTLERAEKMLERADLPLRAGEAFTAYAGIVFASLAVGLLLVGGIIGLLIFGALGIVVPPAVVNFLAARRTKAFVSQLPDTLQLLSSTLKAGYSFMQGVEAVSHEVEEPMGGELRRVVTEAQLGRPLEEAMDASAERMDSDDFAWCVMAVRIQREVGGNLSELLMTVAETMTARERLRRDVAALTAEGKMSAIVLAALPILLGFAMWALNPEYIETLFTDGLGKVLLGASIVAALIGFAWMKKIIDIEI